jgi:hypothetical protein
VGLDAAIESAENKEVGTMLRTRRIGNTLNVQPFQNMTFNVAAATTRTKDDGGTNHQKSSFVSIEAHYAFDFSPALVIHWNGQAFVRYAWNEAQSRNSVFETSNYSRSWAITTGISFNIF